MKSLVRIKLNKISSEELANRQMNELKGGITCCTCSCYWEGNGGSSSNDNAAANTKIGPYGGYSEHGDNNYIYCG